MNWYKIFYWITVADGVKRFFDVASNIFSWFAVISLIGYIVTIGIRSSIDNPDDDDQRIAELWIKGFRRVFTSCLILSMITWAGYIFCPTKKDALIIVAGGAVGNFIASDSSAKQIPSELTNLLRLKMRSEIESIKNPIDYINEDTLKNKTKEELIEMYKEKTSSSQSK